MQLVKQAFGVSSKRATKGEYGLEIEIEGSDFFQPSKYWKAVPDGSLHNGIEYVLRKPLSREELEKSLDLFEEGAKESKMRTSVRTSTHLHINMQDETLMSLFNTITLYFVFEPVLTKWCGDKRDGNLFCLKGCDAEYMPHLLRQALKSLDWRTLDTDDIRYASMNLLSLFKFGSLEFRSMRTPDGNYKQELLKWVDLISCLKEKARGFNSPAHIMGEYSGGDKANFCEKIFGPLSDELFNVEGFEERMQKGIRIAQEIGYSIDWEILNRPAIINPFEGQLC
jgi:hypothetical protein